MYKSPELYKSSILYIIHTNKHSNTHNTHARTHTRLLAPQEYNSFPRTHKSGIKAMT